ncbi:MoxR-like ATPase [Youngiibacter multivorans]|uniref:MoxR-like ATPase n=1 Tax=Youngiibacter multivorans TaxID=937251 RepID=A0ABS4G5F7_9CLOT|nr:MoxR family ATPase [Youngiibacter multivorans]MBP1919761.1 MoxR-like ATPase [Youngiibacter multivorans]
MEVLERIEKNIEKVILGKDREIRNILKGMLAGGHILIEDIPGIGKTTLVKALARSVDLTYSRIQFTPDLLPSDITGVSIYNQKTMNFEYRKGPIFANVVLADEINRTSPKTQSALLEVMEENQVSEGNSTYALEKPFFVMATQNPIEYEGTFNLPEAQLDRFMIRIRIGYPSHDDEIRILMNFREENPLEALEPVATKEDILILQDNTRRVRVSDEIYDYIVRITSETRTNRLFTLGASPRASLALMKIGQASALISGRDYVIPEDIKENASMVLSHRVQTSAYARSQGTGSLEAIKLALAMVDPPKIGR